MTQREFSPDQLKAGAKQTARQASPWIEPLGRFGFAAKGVVYTIVGVLAIQTALGRGGETTDSQGALQRIAGAPFGRILLGIMAVGLVGYALWRFVQALLDTDNKGHDAKGRTARTFYAIVGVIYLGLAFSAVQLISGSGGGGSSQQDWTARLMAQPFGTLLVALVGAGVIGVGGYQLYKGYTASFRKHLRSNEMSATEETWATRSGRLGYAARGIVFAIAGMLLIIAALRSNPDQPQGIGGALQTLAQQPYGPWLLGVVALGLIAYGIFCGVEARYRRMFFR